MWISGGSSFVYFACDVAVLVVVATVVRRHRPDAYRGLLAWSIGTTAVYALMTIAHMVTPYLLSSGGIDSFYKSNALLSILGMLLHLGLLVVFIRGLVALAQPPKPYSPSGDPPYR
jgi:hypothetical protein